MSEKHRFRRPPRTWSVITMFFVLGLAAFYGGFWFVMAEMVTRQFDDWVAEERTDGHTLAFEEENAQDTPFAIKRHLRNVKWSNGKSAAVQIDDIRLSVRPWCWRSVEATFENGAGITTLPPLASLPLTFQADRGAGSFTWNKAGLWTRAQQSVSGLKIGQAGATLLSASTLHMTAERAKTPPKDYKETGIAFSADANGIKVKTEKALPFGDTLSHVDVTLRVMGNAPDFRSKKSVAAWNANSGIIEIDSLRLDWSPLNIILKGTLAPTTALQPEGAFTVTLPHREAVIRALITNKWFSDKEIDKLRSELALIPKTDATDPASNDNVPISLQGGGMFIGMSRIVTIPPLVWQEQ